MDRDPLIVAADKFPEEQYVNSLIGHGSRFKGDVEIDGLFRVDGDFSGSIKTDGKVLIGNNGRADCTINARVVVIGGLFRGTIYAQEKVLFLSSAMILGNVYTPRLVAEEGVLLHCSLVITGKKERQPKLVQSRMSASDPQRIERYEGSSAGSSDSEKEGRFWGFGRKRRQNSNAEGSQTEQALNADGRAPAKAKDYGAN